MSQIISNRRGKYGRHLPPISRCCNARLVRYDATIGRFVEVETDQPGELRCSKCNRVVQER